ncbi:MAG: CdaR family protein [Acidobacteriota bacterium]|nr:CdaR family protein [Acidobacteriota bacterium]
MKAKTVAGWLFKNPGWKLLSLVLAIVIWINVATEPEMSTLISVPVQYKEPSANLEVSSRLAETVQLEMRGSSGRLRQLAQSQTAVILDFSKVREPGDRTFSITRAETNLPRGIELLRATPAQVRFHFERSERRTVPVIVNFTGTPPNGLRLGGHRTDPAMEEIIGPESHVRRVLAATTDVIDLGAVNPAKPSVTTEVYLSDPQVRFVGKPRVTVKMVLN